MTFATNATGYRRVDIKKNAGDYVGRTRMSTINAGSAIPTAVICESSVLTVTSGDYFEVNALQDSGGSLNISGTGSAANTTWFAMEIVE